METWTVEETLETTFDGLEEVSIRLIGGDIAVAAGEGPARLAVTDVDQGPVEVRYRNGHLEVWHRESGGSGRRGLFGILSLGRSPSATVTLTVPPTTRVSIATISGDAVVAGLAEPADLKTVSGDVTLKDCTERIEVKTVSGDVEANGLRGDLRFATVSGDLTVVNGTSSWLSTKTVSGDVLLDLDLHPEGTYSFQTVSGDVALRVGPDPQLTLDMQTMSGSLETPWEIDFPARGAGKRRVQHVLGAGGAQITVRSISGDLTIVPRSEAGAA